MSVEPVRLYALPCIGAGDRKALTIAPGATVADIVALALPSALPEHHAMVRVVIGDSLIPLEAWTIVRPKPGVTVTVRLIPENSGLLRTALSITVAVAAMALGQFYVGPLLATSLGFAAGSVGFSAAVSVATGALGIAGTLLVNALVPVRQSNQASGALNLPSYSVSGWKNNLSPDAPVPWVAGTIRYAGPHFAQQYTEAIGDDSYVYALIGFGFGPLSIPDDHIRIGDTPLSKFKEVVYEKREGYPDDAPVTIFPKQVIQEQVSIELSSGHAGQFGPDSRFTPADITEYSIDFTFPNGLIAFTEVQSGETKVNQQGAWSVAFQIRERLETTEAWTVVESSFAIANMTQRTFVRTYKRTVPTRGRYEVEVTRISADWDDIDQSSQPWKIISRSWWSAIRGYRPEYPINFGAPLAMIAIKVKATRQLNGMLDSLNAYCSRICLDWDKDTQTWVSRVTSNPASLYRYALQGPAFVYPKGDDEIDLEQLQYWHEFCSARGLAYNRVHDYEGSLWDALSDIAAAGRAAPTLIDGKWSVVIDEVKTVVMAHISPRNSWSFSGERPYSRFPDGFRVRFQDETSKFGFTEAERIIPWPDFVGDPQTVEALELPGFTDPAKIWIEARRRQYEAIYRRDTWNVMQDYESLVARRGDLVRLSHDVLDRVQVASKVVRVEDSFVMLDDPVTMEDGQSYAIRFRKLPTSDSLPDISLLRTVRTVAGATDVLYFTGSGDVPDIGDLAFFGTASSESFEAIVKGMEGAENFGQRVTLIPHAPEIQTLADAEVPPPWDGRVGAEAGISTLAPPVPTLGTIRSGLDAGPEPPINVFVPATPGTGAGGQTASFEIDHRLSGAGSWTTTTVPAASGGATITDYSKGDNIEVRARAVGYGASPLTSAYTSTVTHVVAANDPVPMHVTAFTVAQVSATTWEYSFALDAQPAGTGVRIKYRVGHYTAWADLTSSFGGVITASPHDSSTPTIVDGTEYSFGAVAINSAGQESGDPIIIQVVVSAGGAPSLDFSDAANSQNQFLGW